jgi:hypothetical protein
MTAARRFAGCLAAVAVAAMAPVAPASGGASHRAPARLLVAADEWSLVLSRSTLAAGPAIVQFQNRGQDPHDLRLRAIGGAASRQPIGIAEIRPSRLGDLQLRLSPGRYRLWCSLPGHRAKGMRAVLRVRRAR